MDSEALPNGWVVWNEEPGGRLILAYRPDVFNAANFDPACLPTVYVTNGSPRPRPGSGSEQTDTWRVILFLEPEVEVSDDAFDSREDALEGAIDRASAFATGSIAYRRAYQVPRERYLEKLDELTGRSDRHR
ncbi:MAG: DUF5820 family protein [Halobacteriota archaeon]